MIELNKQTKNSRIAMKDLLINQMQNFTMKAGEMVNQLHTKSV